MDERWCLRFASTVEQKLWREALDAFLQPFQSYRILSTEQRLRSAGAEAGEVRDDLRLGEWARPGEGGADGPGFLETVKTTEYRAAPVYHHSGAELDLHRLTHIGEQMPRQFEQVLAVLRRVVQTNAAPLDLAIVEQTVDRCKQVAEALRYLQQVLPSIQVVPAEEALVYMASSAARHNPVAHVQEVH